MPEYKYKAVNASGKKVKGTLTARNGQDLALQLAERDLILVKHKLCAEGSFIRKIRQCLVPMRELTSFCRRFSVMLDAHIPIPECLYILKNRSRSRNFKRILNSVYDDIKGGLLLSEAFGKHNRSFPAFFISMIRIGEISEKLDTVLSSLADYYDKDAALRRRIKGAMSYPAMLAVMTLGIIVLMLGFVVPTLRQALIKLDVEITGFTKIVYDVSDFLILNKFSIPITLALIFLILYLILSTERGKYFFDALKLKLPLYGRLHLQTVTARFSRGFGLLLSSGMDLDEAMSFVAVMIENRHVKKRFVKAAEDVCQGESLPSALEEYKLFTPELIQMTEVGERTASFGSVFMQAAEFFDAEVDASMNSFVSKLQPMMLIILGAVIGAIFVAVYSPMLSIINGLM